MNRRPAEKSHADRVSEALAKLSDDYKEMKELARGDPPAELRKIIADSREAAEFVILVEMQVAWNEALSKENLPPPFLGNEIVPGDDGVDIIRRHRTLAELLDISLDKFSFGIDLTATNRQALLAIKEERKQRGIRPRMKKRSSSSPDLLAFLFLYLIRLRGDKPHILAHEYLNDVPDEPPDPTHRLATRVRDMRDRAARILEERRVASRSPRQ